MSRRRQEHEDDGTSFEDFLRWKRREEASKAQNRRRQDDSDDEYDRRPVTRRVTTTSYAMGYDGSSEEDYKPRSKTRRYYEDEDSDSDDYRRPKARVTITNKTRPRGRSERYDEYDRYRERYDYSDSDSDSEEYERSRRHKQPRSHKSSSKSSKPKASKSSKRNEERSTKTRGREEREEREERRGRDEYDDGDEPSRNRKTRNQYEDDSEPEKRSKSKNGSSKKNNNNQPQQQEGEEKGNKESTPPNFDHVKWLNAWNKKFQSDQPVKTKRSKLKELLNVINRSTEIVTDMGKYRVTETKEGKVSESVHHLSRKEIASSVKQTHLYTYDDLLKFLPKEKGTKKTTAHMIRSDILEVALYVKQEIQKNPLVLMMVDDKIPGSKDHCSLYGQETSIWRRTTIAQNLDSNLREKYFSENEQDNFVYDIPRNGAVYCPNVYVIRDSQKKGFALRPPEQLSFVCVPPLLKKVAQGSNTRPELSENEVEIVKKKIALIFLTALAHGHDSVVLSAFGCGYANNRPKQIADLFVQVIRDFRSQFANIVFAIVDNANSKKANPEGNIKPFEAAFKSLKPTGN